MRADFIIFIYLVTGLFYNFSDMKFKAVARKTGGNSKMQKNWNLYSFSARSVGIYFQTFNFTSDNFLPMSELATLANTIRMILAYLLKIFILFVLVLLFPMHTV